LWQRNGISLSHVTKSLLHVNVSSILADALRYIMP